MAPSTTAPRDSAAYRDFRAARDHLLRHRGDLEAARDFPRPSGEYFNWALDWCDVQAEDNHAVGLRVVDLDADGSLLGETALTFAELRERSDRTAGWLRAQGVARGDRVLLLLGNRVALWEVMLAAIKLGAVVIPASTLLSPHDLADRLDRGRVRHVIAESPLTPGFAGQEGDWSRIAVGEPVPGWLDYAEAAGFSADFTPNGPTRAEDPLLLYFTSGTTSRPKLVEHTHRSYPVGHLSTMYWIGLRPGDVHLNVSSPGWAKHAWSNFFAPWNAGAEILIVNQPRFSAGPLLDALVRCQVTSFCAPPTVWRMLLLEDLTRWQPPLRELVGAGEPLNPEVVQRIERAWGVALRDGYGQTETSAQIGNTPGQPVKPGSMGRPLPGYSVVLVDPVTGAEITDEGVAGELCLPLASAPLGLMTGYQGDPERQAESMAGDRYHTGDVAFRDADGYYTFVGRGDEVFKSSDYRLSPFELESVLIEHPAVAEAAVVPSPDPLRLSVPKAYVVLAPGHAPDAETARSILAWARTRLAPYKRIRRLEFSDLPKTISGKIRRVELRDREQELHHAGPELPGSDTLAAPAAAAPAPARGEREFWEEDFPGLKDA
ncbi:AMP-binding protein [Streptacidiphilus sp. PB12-B1b]|uniref:AMP-binding protein n=1 Tax=Streptacidiphilus sp. PB12-B1b TaxID=2705012 RepID=UPI0015F84D3D|nr:AMP-binding protein [Streptacidiphilus sp. PB12-B1b]QMU78697.1 AMP-binding protein [Streptacidiphilus sp. PB12-B1b]